MQQHGQPYHRLGGSGRHTAGGVFVYIVSVVGVVLLEAHHGRQLGNDLRQHLRVGEQHPQHVLSAKQPEQLTAQPFRRDLLQELPAPPQRLLCLFLQREA